MFAVCSGKCQAGETVLVHGASGAVSVDVIHTLLLFTLRWLGSRVVSMLDSGAEGPRVQIAVATLSGNSLRHSVHTDCASVHQVAAL